MVQNSLLRANARKQLGGGIFKKPWLMMVVALLVYCALVVAIEFGMLFTFGLAVFVMGTLTVGWNKIALNGIRKNQWNVSDLFGGFKYFWKSFGLCFLQTLYLGLWSLLIIPPFIKQYSYAMAYYIHIDNPELSANECITISRKMMDGHKWQLFCLNLSFVGWYLLGFLCLGLGVPFVDAYKATAMANFYLALKAEVSAR